jgi:uncharacterized membrane protein
MILVSGLGAGYLALEDATWISHSYLGWTLLACTVASTLGLIVAAGRLRVLVYDDPGPQSPSHGPSQGVDPGSRTP